MVGNQNDEAQQRAAQLFAAQLEESTVAGYWGSLVFLVLSGLGVPATFLTSSFLFQGEPEKASEVYLATLIAVGFFLLFLLIFVRTRKVAIRSGLKSKLPF